MIENIDSNLLILWPDAPIQAGYTEYNHGLDFCKNYLKYSLQNNNIPFNWHTYSSTYEQTNRNINAKYVLVVKDPLLLINALPLISMMQMIDKGFDAVGPCFNQSRFSTQVSSPTFLPLNTSTYQELSNHFKNNTNLTSHDVHQLDGSCALISIGYFTTHLNFKVNIEEAYYLPATLSTHFGVLKNSFVFTFAGSDDHSRDDLASLVPENSRWILDIGCSYGRLGKTIREKYPNTMIHGIEPNLSKTKVATQYYNEIFNSNIEDFPNSQKYDCIICGDVLEHLLNPGEQLKHISSLLNPSGYLIVSVPNAGHWTMVSDVANGRFEYLPWGISCITHYHWFTEITIIQAIEDSGLKIVTFEQQQIEPSPEGKLFIKNMVELKYGNEQSLLTNEFIIKAIKQ
jgi:2-polyprenyl-3-methyl-5-hydroxy-6-metoxy-1,4-benzoquinol methylase